MKGEVRVRWDGWDGQGGRGKKKEMVAKHDSTASLYTIACGAAPRHTALAGNHMSLTCLVVFEFDIQNAMGGKGEKVSIETPTRDATVPLTVTH